MEYEFIDDMLERLLVVEQRTFGEAFEQIIRERAKIIQDLCRIENAYQLFVKKHPDAKPEYFRRYIKGTRPGDYEKCVRCFKWKTE